MIVMLALAVMVSAALWFVLANAEHPKPRRIKVRVRDDQDRRRPRG